MPYIKEIFIMVLLALVIGGNLTDVIYERRNRQSCGYCSWLSRVVVPNLNPGLSPFLIIRYQRKFSVSSDSRRQNRLAAAPP